MSKLELKRNFLNKLESFYRNFGNQWSIDDFASNTSQKEYLKEFLIDLAAKGVVSVNEDGKSFTVLDLPSNHNDLFS